MKTTFILILTGLLLASCTTAPRPTLDQLLAGKTKDEQRAFLRSECLKGTSYRSIDARHPYWTSGDLELKKEVCNKMANQMKL